MNFLQLTKIMYLLAITEGSETITQFVLEMLGKVGSPALILLILGMIVAIIYFKKNLAEKEAQNKELNKALLDSAVSNLKIIHEIEASIDKRDERSARMEDSLRDLSVILKMIAKTLNI